MTVKNTDTIKETIKPTFNMNNIQMRKTIGNLISYLLIAFSSITILILVLTIITLFYYGYEVMFYRDTDGFGTRIPEILFNANWNPKGNTLVSEAENIRNFGALSLTYGTFYVGAMAIGLAIFFGVGSAILLSEYIPQRISRVIQPIIEFFSAIPTVIYGLLAFYFLSEFIVTVFGTVAFRDFTSFLGLNDGRGYAVLSGRGALNAAIAVSFLSAPIIISMSYNAMQSTPALQRQSAIAFGATRYEVYKNVVQPHAKKTIFASILLAFGRVVGETMILLMVLGQSPNITFNPFAPHYALSAAIAAEIGDASFFSLEFKVIFVLGIMLMVFSFLIMWLSNLILSENKIMMAIISTLMFPFEIIGNYIQKLKERIYENKALENVDIAKMIKNRRRMDILQQSRLGSILLIYFVSVGVLLYFLFTNGLKYFTKHGWGNAPIRFWEFITRDPVASRMAVGDYGIRYATTGSILLIIFASLMSIPIATAAGIYLHEFTKGEKWSEFVKTAIINISALPSIVVGLVVYGLFSIGLGWQKGLLPGSIAFAIMMIPIIATNTIESLRNITDDHQISALALGSSKWEAFSKHKLPYSSSSIITGYVLGIARVIGETAPILFTAAAFVYGDRTLPSKFINEPIRVLTYEIYYNAIFNPNRILAREWSLAMAIVLFMLIVILNFVAYGLRRYISKRYEFNGNI
jgi:phosphate ABC transporter permease protein PstC/phosphate ABC transporter permease subunit PstA